MVLVFRTARGKQAKSPQRNKLLTPWEVAVRWIRGHCIKPKWAEAESRKRTNLRVQQKSALTYLKVYLL